MADSDLMRLVHAKHYAIDFIEEAFDEVDNFDLTDLDSCFQKLNGLMDKHVPKDMHEIVREEMRKIVEDLITHGMASRNFSQPQKRDSTSSFGSCSSKIDKSKDQA